MFIKNKSIFFKNLNLENYYIDKKILNENYLNLLNNEVKNTTFNIVNKSIEDKGLNNLIKNLNFPFKEEDILDGTVFDFKQIHFFYNYNKINQKYFYKLGKKIPIKRYFFFNSFKNSVDFKLINSFIKIDLKNGTNYFTNYEFLIHNKNIKLINISEWKKFDSIFEMFINNID